MKSSIVLLSGASVALAGPLARHQKVDIVYDVVTNVVTEVDYYTVVVPAEPVETPVVTSTPPAVVVVTVAATSSSSTSQAPKVDIAAPTTTATSTYEAATAAASPTDFEGIALWHHNAHRANSSATDLTYDTTIAGYAATLAERCEFAHDVTIGNPSSAYGQNIAMYASTDLDSLEANTFLAQCISDMWYNAEIDLYPNSYGAEPDMTNFEKWGHYSQVVWKGTQTTGCAVQRCNAGTMESSMDAYFCVCNYSPAGNVATEYADNVGQPLGDSTVAA